MAMFSEEKANPRLRAIVDGRLRSVVEIDGAMYYRYGPRYNDGYAVYPIANYEVVDLTDFAVAMRCCREYGLTLTEMEELGHAQVISKERFNRLDSLTNPIDFQFDHPGILPSGVTYTYRITDGRVLHADCA